MTTTTDTAVQTCRTCNHWGGGIHQHSPETMWANCWYPLPAALGPRPMCNAGTRDCPVWKPIPRVDAAPMYDEIARCVEDYRNTRHPVPFAGVKTEEARKLWHRARAALFNADMAQLKAKAGFQEADKALDTAMEEEQNQVTS